MWLRVAAAATFAVTVKPLMQLGPLFLVNHHGFINQDINSSCSMTQIMWKRYSGNLSFETDICQSPVTGSPPQAETLVLSDWLANQRFVKVAVVFL